MGEHAQWEETSSLLPNGLLPNEGLLVIRAFDSERWSKAEERTSELITRIQPYQPSEERRNAVADYVQRLITNCFPCQVFTFGSVPLKTYLPDGDIDLTAFSDNEDVKDSWANQVRDVLKSEEKNENAEFNVKEVQYIQAEVKIIKCLVENIVVDISFNQLGGLCTLCFLEEVDHLINQNHLFKRSIILIKAWCYYESRILGAHHGLISTYALETLVLYIFHVFNNSFSGPLEVLYRFLEFFSNFDWDNFCVSLWGPVPIRSLPDITAEPPRKDSGELLLSKLFLDACSSVYAVFPGSQDDQGQPFVSKHFNVIDPLRINNNLGRSVSKGNFFRIRSAFAFGAKRLANLLDCPRDNLISEVNQFFLNTWDRHGSGPRSDSTVSNLRKLRLSNLDPRQGFESIKTSLSSRKMNVNASHEIEAEGCHRIMSLESTSRSSTQSQNSQNNVECCRDSELILFENTSNRTLHSNMISRNPRPENSLTDVQGRFMFARTRSSPELTKTFNTGKDNISSTRLDNRKMMNPGPDVLSNHEVSANMNNAKNFNNEDVAPVIGTCDVQKEEQNLVNILGSARFHGFNSQFNAPLNLSSGQLPFSISQSVLASMGYGQRNVVPTNIPMQMHFPPMIHYFPNAENVIVSGNESLDHDIWHDHEKLRSDDQQHTNSTSGRAGSSGSSTRGSRHKFIKENRRTYRNDHDDRENEVYLDDGGVNSRIRNNSSFMRSKTSSESLWDVSSLKGTKPTREKWGRTVSVTPPIGHRMDKTVSEHGSSHGDDDNKEWEIVGKSIPTLHVPSTQGSDPLIPITFVGPRSRHMSADNPGHLPFAFYPTGPPVPFFTMLPMYSFPSETDHTDASTSHGGDIDDPDTNNSNSSSKNSSWNFDPEEGVNYPEASTVSDDLKPDILNGDFTSHWQNLQYGRFCQNGRPHGPTMYPSLGVVPHSYLQNPGGPVSANINFNQMMGYNPRFFPLTHVPNRPAAVYQRYGDEIPRHRSGTGTYLPNHKVPARERHSSNHRRGGYNNFDRNYDRNDHHGDREGNWNVNPKSRASVRNHNSSQHDKQNNDSTWGPSYRHDSFRPNSIQSNGPHMAYGTYHHVQPINSGASSSRPVVPPVVMLYPYDHNPVFGPHDEQVEFVHAGPRSNPGTNETLHMIEQRSYGSVQLCSPDQPSSPHIRRGI